MHLQDLGDIWQAELRKQRASGQQIKQDTWVQKLMPRRNLLFFKVQAAALTSPAPCIAFQSSTEPSVQ